MKKLLGHPALLTAVLLFYSCSFQRLLREKSHLSPLMIGPLWLSCSLVDSNQAQQSNSLSHLRSLPSKLAPCEWKSTLERTTGKWQVRGTKIRLWASLGSKPSSTTANGCCFSRDEGTIQVHAGTLMHLEMTACEKRWACGTGCTCGEGIYV